MRNVQTHDWQELPLFVPYGSEHLSAVVTIPGGEPRGMVLLMPGYGAPRSHRFQMWARTARRLAEDQQVASIRFDYLGFGDATGLVKEWSWGEDVPAARQARAVARTGLDLLGLNRFMAVGNCTGAATAVRLASEMPECVGAVSVLMWMLKPPGSGVVSKLGRTKAANVVRQNAFLRRHVGRPIKDRVHRNQPEVARSLAMATLDHARLLFVYGEEDWMWSPRVGAEFERTVQELPEEYRPRFALKVIPGARLMGFESVPVQELMIDLVTDWSGVCFAGSEHDESTHAVPTMKEAEVAVRMSP